VSPSVLGLAAHATHFVVLPTLGGLLLLLNALDSGQLMAFGGSGLLFGLAFLMKQPAVFFVAFGFLYLLWALWKVRPFVWRRCAWRSVVFLAGATIPFGVTCLILVQAGVFQRFWFWTFTYAREYVSETPVSAALTQFWDRLILVIGPSFGLWILAGIGVIGMLWKQRCRDHAVLVIGFLGFSFLSVCPGFFFRPHYFILVLPAVSLLVGVTLKCVREFLVRGKSPNVWEQGVPGLIVLAALGYSVIQEKQLLFELPPAVASRNIYDRSIYGPNPFPESLEVAKYIKAHTAGDARIAVLGSEPQICFYSGRRSATGYIYIYSMMELQPLALRMQREMIDEIEAARPEFVVFVNLPLSWWAKPNSERMILEWSERYLKQNYDLVGVADIVSFDVTEYRWDNQVKDYQPQSLDYLLVYKKKLL
jgi:hypothetical protein